MDRVLRANVSPRTSDVISVTTSNRVAVANWRPFIACIVAIYSLSTLGANFALGQTPAAKPVPRVQVTPQPYDQASVQLDGVEFTRYHFGPALKRSFLFPLIGPSGRSVTRMGHPRDPNGHSHHNSVWIAHNDVNGVDFWGDKGQGRIAHVKVLKYDDTDRGATIAVLNHWLDGGGKKLLEEQRTMEFEPAGDGEWILRLDLEFKAAGEPVQFGKSPFGPVGVRMAKTIGVHDGGGTIRNSEGGVDEKGVHWKRARWVDYSGPITADRFEGITLIDHPENPGHPNFFHVRDDGWMGTSPSYESPVAITAEKPLRLRYVLWVHAGVPTLEKLAQRAQQLTQPMRRGE